MRIAVVARPKPDKEGALPLYVRVAHGGQDRYVALGLRVHKKDWNARKGEVRSTHPQAGRLNEVLSERLTTAHGSANDLAASGRHFTADRLKAAVEAALHPEPVEVRAVGEGPCLLTYARTYIAEVEAEGRAGTAYAYGSAVRHLEEANATLRREPRLPMDAIDAGFLRSYYARLVGPASEGGLGLSKNYAAKCVGFLRTVLRRAVGDGVPGAAAAVGQFAAVRLRRERGEKERLSLV
jgi:integrase/recombinase XerC